ncbi:MAG: universal stress protein [Betaproteobacteria bacterium]
MVPLPEPKEYMTYRSISVHVDDAEPCDRRLAFAARLARAHSAELLGGYLVPTLELTPFTAALLPGDVVDRRMGETADAQRSAEARFRAAAAQAGVASVEWRAPAGDPLAAAVLHARYADLAVIGQPSRDGPTEAFSAELAKAVVVSCGRPVLFVPYAGDYKNVGERVMIAWKDSRESARAVNDALPLLKGAKQVFAVVVTADDENLHDRLAEAQFAAFLRRHQVEATVRRLALPDINAGELLLSEAADFRADLIVMGAYSRPRVSAFVWGSVTQLMLSSMTIPVLMSH